MSIRNTPKIPKLSDADFVRYGTVVASGDDGYRSLFTEPRSDGWQVALNNLTQGPVTSLHRHNGTAECFAPLKGETGLLVAIEPCFEHVCLYEMLHPVVLRAGIWHELVAISESAQTLICENATVDVQRHELKTTIQVDAFSGKRPGGTIEGDTQ